MASLQEALVGSIVLSLIATAALYGIIWMIRNGRRRCVSTPRPFDVPNSLYARLRNLTSTANRALRFRTPMVTPAYRTGAYELCNKKLPIAGKVLEQVRGLAKSNEPFSGLLISTHPPTIKIMESGTMSVVTRLIPIEDFDANNLNRISHEDVVATFHTHRSDLSVFEHDERIFRLVDAFAGPKIHIIGSVRGLRFYRARGSPAMTTRDRNVEVR